MTRYRAAPLKNGNWKLQYKRYFFWFTVNTVIRDFDGDATDVYPRQFSTPADAMEYAKLIEQRERVEKAQLARPIVYLGVF